MNELGQRVIAMAKRFASWAFSGASDIPTEYDHDDWLLVARHVNPLITDEEFEDQWEEFIEVKRRREMH